MTTAQRMGLGVVGLLVIADALLSVAAYTSLPPKQHDLAHVCGYTSMFLLILAALGFFVAMAVADNQKQ